MKHMHRGGRLMLALQPWTKRSRSLEDVRSLYSFAIWLKMAAFLFRLPELQSASSASSASSAKQALGRVGVAREGLLLCVAQCVSLRCLNSQREDMALAIALATWPPVWPFWACARGVVLVSIQRDV